MAKCFVLKGPEGERVVTLDGTPYTMRLGEVRVRTIICPENGQPIPIEAIEDENVKEKKNRAQLIKELDRELGKGAGDWIKTFAKPVAALVGKNRCSSCETRRVVTNAFAQLGSVYGKIEALRIIKELWQMSFNKEDQEVIERLRYYLHPPEDKKND